MFRFLPLPIIFASILICAPALARERLITDPDSPYFLSDTDQTYADPNQNFVLRGSVGITSIQAIEHVFAGPSGTSQISQLNWDSVAPIASADIKARFGDAWTLRGHLDAAIAGDSNMVDYDWAGAYFAGYDPNNWTHRSISPNTNLDWYLNGEVAMGRDLPISDALLVNVNGGFKYTDVQWTASGGTFTYSVGGFRDTSGVLPGGPGIRYHMRLPTVFLGLDADVKDGPWSLETSTKAGLTVLAGDTDNHYLRNLLFVDDLSWSQVYSVNARLAYDFSDHFGAFLEGSYEKMISGHGDEDEYDTTTGNRIGHFAKAVGADLQVASLKLGLKGNF